VTNSVTLLDRGPAITIRVAVAKLSRHHDETQAAEAVLTDSMKPGLTRSMAS